MTMRQEFAKHIKVVSGKKYQWWKRKIQYVIGIIPRFYSFTIIGSRLAHVINLATQALIGTYSKSPHFDPRTPELHIPTSRDEVGLVRAIVVKVSYFFHLVLILLMQERLSSKRKQMWWTIQLKAGVSKPLQLIMDMKARWSSNTLQWVIKQTNKQTNKQNKQTNEQNTILVTGVEVMFHWHHQPQQGTGEYRILFFFVSIATYHHHHHSLPCHPPSPSPPQRILPPSPPPSPNFPCANDTWTTTVTTTVAHGIT
jgi:hypothetical protein